MGALHGGIPHTMSDGLNNMSSTTLAIIESTTSMQAASVYLWLPLIVVLVFAAVVIILVIIGKQSRSGGQCPCAENVSRRSACGDAHSAESLQANDNIAFSAGDEVVPSTPPPTYSAIARQISYASYISQSSSQLEIPPGYDEAVTIQDSTAADDPALNTLPNGSKPSLKLTTLNRFRLFSRSLSGGETPTHRGLSMSSGSASDLTSARTAGLVGTRRASETVVEHPELEEFANEQHRAEQDRAHSARFPAASDAQNLPEINASSVFMGSENPANQEAAASDADSDDAIVIHIL